MFAKVLTNVCSIYTIQIEHTFAEGLIMKICIKNKIRFISFLTVTIITLIVFCSPFNTKSYSNTLPKEVVVQKGETLWKIVNKHYPNENLPKKTYEIAEINNIADGNIYPG